MQAARFGSEGCVLRLLSHGAGRLKRDKAGKTASDLAISAGHLHIAGIVSADPKRLDLMEIAAQVSSTLPYIWRAAGPNVPSSSYVFVLDGCVSLFRFSSWRAVVIILFSRSSFSRHESGWLSLSSSVWGS